MTDFFAKKQIFVESFCIFIILILLVFSIFIILISLVFAIFIIVISPV